MRPIILVLLALLLPYVAPAFGDSPAGGDPSDRPVALPDTPVGRQLTRWLAAFNSGDRETMQRFVTEQWAKSAPPWMKPVRFFEHVYPPTRGIDPYEVVYASDYRLVFLGRSRLTREWHRVSGRVEVKPPHGLVVNGIFLDPGPQTGRSRRKLQYTEIRDALAAHLEALGTADQFSGAVLVAKDGATVFARAYGLADRERNKRNRVDTRFCLASMGKMFTAVAVCQLAEQQKLSFDDPIVKHLPEYPNRAVAGKVTIHHLLTHTSGMGDFFGKKEYEVSKARLRKPADYFPYFANDPLAFEPGTDSQYSNAGFIVLGAIVERVSGQPFLDYVREHIFQPAEMTNSGYNEAGSEVPGLALPYEDAGWDSCYDRSRPGSPITRKSGLPLHGSGSPAGGGYSTVEDLFKFARALRKHKLLGPSYSERIFTGKGELGTFGALSINHVYGFQYREVGGERVVGHGGGYPGVSGQLDMYVGRGWTVISLSNYDPPTGHVPNEKFRELALQGTDKVRHTLIGTVRTHKNFRSNILRNARDIWVYLPPGYEAEKPRRYPVLYLHDGQSLFDEATAGGPEWRVDETAQALIEARAVEPLIIVGVANGGEYRMDEYTPTLDPQTGAGGRADLYGRMLVEELKPFIDGQYRTLTDAGNTGLGGASFGGLVSLYLGLKHPQTFGKLALLSPSVNWDGKVILRQVQALGAKPGLRIWLDVGTAEGFNVEAAKAVLVDARKLRDALVSKGWVLDTDLRYFEAKGAGHETRAWASRVDPMLRYLFPMK
jgi:CubicO group peptidase (beta-lactamase class C family)